MNQINKTIIRVGAAITLCCNSLVASEILKVTPKNLLAMDDNVGKVIVKEDISEQCHGSAFKIDFSQAYGKMMWQNILTYQVSRQFKALRVYTEDKDGVCWAKKIEIISN